MYLLISSQKDASKAMPPNGPKRESKIQQIIGTFSSEIYFRINQMLPAPKPSHKKEYRNHENSEISPIKIKNVGIERAW